LSCGGGKNLRDNYRLLYVIFHIACHINPKAPRLIWVESWSYLCLLPLSATVKMDHGENMENARYAMKYIGYIGIVRILLSTVCIMINTLCMSYQPEGPKANMGRELIWHVIWKMPYHNVFIIIQTVDKSIRTIPIYPIYFIAIYPLKPLNYLKENLACACLGWSSISHCFADRIFKMAAIVGLILA
jgi:vacuolar-type H+-ATPase subunit I/STV1